MPAWLPENQGEHFAKQPLFLPQPFGEPSLAGLPEEPGENWVWVF
jgi:hypothetical protein